MAFLPLFFAGLRIGGSYIIGDKANRSRTGMSINLENARHNAVRSNLLHSIGESAAASAILSQRAGGFSAGAGQRAMNDAIYNVRQEDFKNLKNLTPIYQKRSQDRMSLITNSIFSALSAMGSSGITIGGGKVAKAFSGLTGYAQSKMDAGDNLSLGGLLSSAVSREEADAKSRSSGGGLLSAFKKSMGGSGYGNIFSEMDNLFSD